MNGDETGPLGVSWTTWDGLVEALPALVLMALGLILGVALIASAGAGP